MKKEIINWENRDYILESTRRPKMKLGTMLAERIRKDLKSWASHLHKQDTVKNSTSKECNAMSIYYRTP